MTMESQGAAKIELDLSSPCPSPILDSTIIKELLVKETSVIQPSSAPMEPSSPDHPEIIQLILNPFTGQLVDPLTMEPTTPSSMEQLSSKLASIDLDKDGEKLVDPRSRRLCPYDFHYSTLADSERAKAYRDVIMKNKHLFQGKVVLALDCMIGLFSMYAAKAGASRVIAYDSSNITYCAEEIFKLNGLDHIITIMHGKIQDLVLPDGIEKVDIIISEWMGYCLARESTLDNFVYARDKWLKEDGLLFPNKCSLYITCIQAFKQIEDHVSFWGRLYGHTLTCFKSLAITEPSLVQFSKVFEEKLESFCLLEVDMKTVCSNFLCDFKTSFKLVAKENQMLDSFTIFFTVNFDDGDFKLKYSTSPHEAPTRWKHIVLHLNNKIFIQKDESIHGIFCMKSSPNPRQLQFRIGILFIGEMNTVDESNTYYLR